MAETKSGTETVVVDGENVWVLSKKRKDRP